MTTDTPRNPKERPGYRLVFDDDFDGAALDRAKWVPFYLPQWSSRAASAPRYRLADGCLTLFVAEDQAAWCPEFDGDVRVSSIQTGLFSGPFGSSLGQHRFKPGLVVREAQPREALFVPQYGYFELRAKMELGPDDLASLWMIGFEDEPERSGEITVCEIFGKGIGEETAELGYGIKPVNDPGLLPGDFHVDTLRFDPGAFHIYAAEWTPEGVAFFLDNVLLRQVSQSPGYPMQFMLNVYALPSEYPGSRRVEPSFTIDYVRGYAPVGEP